MLATAPPPWLAERIRRQRATETWRHIELKSKGWRDEMTRKSEFCRWLQATSSRQSGIAAGSETTSGGSVGVVDIGKSGNVTVKQAAYDEAGIGGGRRQRALALANGKRAVSTGGKIEAPPSAVCVGKLPAGARLTTYQNRRR